MVNKLQSACVLFTLFVCVVICGTWLPLPVGAETPLPAPFSTGLSGNAVIGGSALTTTGAVPFQSGTVGQLTQNASFTYASSVLTIPASTQVAAFKFSSSCEWMDGGDGFMQLRNNAGTGTCSLFFGPGSGSTSTPIISATRQVNPVLNLQDAGGGNTANLQIGNIKSTTGQRFVCVTTTGLLVSSASACSGT